MRTSEWICAAFFGTLLVAGVVARLGGIRRARVFGIGIAGILGVATLARLGGVPGVEVLRDLFPGLFLLMGYWQSGQFFRGGNAALQAFLRRTEERWFPGMARLSARLVGRRSLSRYLEWAYLMGYPLLPLGVVTLYHFELQGAVDRLWTVVLSATLTCHGLTALLPSLPPRVAEPRGDGPGSAVRSMNLWILRRAGIGANTLPSGHVASSVSLSLVVTDMIPLVGLGFLCAAGSITIATVVLRYHYSIDALLGVVLGLASFLALG